ncbi:MAG TPA: hypothetical protein VFL04_01630, partial [Rectinemataceae bacterium]|nr:hypothetical protein [Rectinemataceae bacterium]
TDFVVTSVVKDFLRYGDTFHLLSFGDTAQVEIAQRMTDERDVKSVLGRLYLLYPLARYTDFIGALGYLYQYLADLPESRQKVAVVITDGVHNPPPGSPTYGYPPEKVAAEVESVAAKIRAQGWPVHFIKLPFPAKAAAGGAKAGGSSGGATGAGSGAATAGPQPTGSEAKAGQSYVDAAAKALGADIAQFSTETKTEVARQSLSLPSVEFPGPLGKREYSFSFPIKVTNSSPSQLGLELDRVRFGELDILSKKAFLSLAPGRSGTMSVPVRLPDSLSAGEQRIEVELYFANGIRTSPQSGELALDLERSPVADFFRSGARLALFALLLVIGLGLALAAIIFLRRLPRRAAEPVVAAVRENSGIPAATGRSGARKTAAAAPAAPAQTASAPRPAAAAAEAAGTELSAASSRARSDAKDRDAAVADAAEAIAAAKRAEAERSAALLAEAAGRKAPVAAQRQAKVAAAKEKPRPAGSPSYTPRVRRPGSVQIELRVEEQNPHIGTRNVQSLQAGSSRSVGGGRSDFLVFLVPIPARVAELHYDGEDLTLVPLKAELFPGGSAPIEGCLGKDIRMLSPGGYPLTLRFLHYERPEARINRLLHCIEAPGLFKDPEA